jgi:hypothetical protein
MLLGLLKVDYAMAFMTMSAIGGAVGNIVVYALVKSYNKTWFVVGILCFVIAISTVLLVCMPPFTYTHIHTHMHT